MLEKPSDASQKILPATRLQGVCLDDQLKLFKLAGAPNLVNCTVHTLTDEKREALSEAVDLYLNDKWKIREDSSNDSDTVDDEEEFPGIDVEQQSWL
jgi:hypothetical protein